MPGSAWAWPPSLRSPLLARSGVRATRRSRPLAQPPPKPTLAVVVVGPGRVTSTPAGISCPGKCAAAFAAGSRVLLTPTPRGGSRFLRWGGDCTGARACRVRVSGLAAVAAQFAGSTTRPAPPAKSSVEPGGYSGYGITFLVPAGAGSVLDFSVGSGYLRVNCVGGGAYQTPIRVPKATIRPDRSFTATISQSGVLNGVNAKWTYSVTGRFQGTDSAGSGDCVRGAPPRHRVHRQPNRKCTSNDQPWTAARLCNRLRSSMALSGSYSALRHHVPCPGRRRERVGLLGPGSGYLRVNCLGGGAYRTPIQVPKATIRPDRSFTATISQSGVLNGVECQVDIFRHWALPGDRLAPGRATAAGVHRQDIVFTDTPNRTCTSNDQPWTAARTG